MTCLPRTLEYLAKRGVRVWNALSLPLKVVFKHYWERALALIPEGVHDFVIPRAFDRFVGDGLASQMEGFTLWADMCGERIPLSSYLVCRHAPHDIGLDWMFCDDYNAWPAVAIVHTEEHNLAVVRAYCADLFEAIRSEDLPLERPFKGGC